MTRLILSPLVGLMMGMAAGWAVYGMIVLAIAASQHRAATPSGRSQQAVSGIAGIDYRGGAQ